MMHILNGKNYMYFDLVKIIGTIYIMLRYHFYYDSHYPKRKYGLKSDKILPE
jgi:hypothetical protein